MADYKKAFGDLYKAIADSGDETSRLQALNIKEQLMEQQQAKPETNKSNVTKEEFATMGYSDRVKFKKKYPEEYESMIGGR